MKNKRTVVIGASDNPERYAYMATIRLLENGHEVFLEGIRTGNIADLPISTERKLYDNIDTVTLYVGPQNQPVWYDYIFALQPKRLIFNPGTENGELMEMAASRGIEVCVACTLVMLSVGNY